MAAAVDSTLRDELAAAADDLRAAKAEQVVRGGEVLELIDDRERLANAIRDVARVLTADQRCHLRMDTLQALDRYALPPAPPKQPSTTD